MVDPLHGSSISAFLSLPFEDDSDPVAIADAIVRVLHDIQNVLTPILGARGVAALYQRSLHTARASHPWLADPLEPVQPSVDLPALAALLALQQRSEAAAATVALLLSLNDLLASLIGPALTERLLGPVWARASSRHAAQESSP